MIWPDWKPMPEQGWGGGCGTIMHTNKIDIFTHIFYIQFTLIYGIVSIHTDNLFSKLASKYTGIRLFININTRATYTYMNE